MSDAERSSGALDAAALKAASEAVASDAAASAAARGRACIVLAAILWSTSGLFVKSELFSQWPLDERGPLLAFWRATFAAVSLAPFVRRSSRPLPWRAMLPMLLAYGAMSFTYLTAMTRSTAANAIWLQSTAPWWVCLLGVLVWREPLARRELLPLVFGVLGVALILWHETGPLLRGGGDRSTALAVGCGLASGACYAVVILSLRRLRDLDTTTLVVANNGAAALLLAPWVIAASVHPTAWQLVVLAAFGAAQLALPYWLMGRGLRSVSSQEAAGLSLLEPALVPIWAWLAAGEVPAWWTLAGGGLILMGLGLRYWVGERG